MIGWLGGTLRTRRGSQIVVDCGGVGYLVTIPVGVAGQTAIGDRVELHVQTRVREDDIALFGFETLDQHDAFEALCAVNGVGPKVAIGILGSLGPAELADAVERDDVARLKAVKGVGKKLAERLSMEMKGKLAGIGTGGGVTPQAASGRSPGRRKGVWGDVASALGNLQYTAREIDGVLQQLAKERPDGKVEELVVAALALLRRVSR